MLISNMLAQEVAPHILTRTGLQSDMLFDQEAREALAWIQRHYTARQALPSVQLFKQTFPAFPFHPTRDSCTGLVEDLIGAYQEVQLRKLCTDTMQYLNRRQSDVAVADVIRRHAQAMMGIRAAAPNHGRTLSESIGRLAERYRLRQTAGGCVGLPFPYPELTAATSGMQPENFIVISGRPKTGKTWFALKCAADAYRLGSRVFCYSREISNDVMMERIAAILSRTDYAKLMTGGLTESEFEAYIGCLSELGARERDMLDGRGKHATIYFHSDADHGRDARGTVGELEAAARDIEPDLMIVDGFYLMTDQQTRKRGRDKDVVGNISMDLKRLAKGMAIPIIGTTQTNRDSRFTSGDDVSDLAFADAIGQDTDLALKIVKGWTGHGYQQLITVMAARECVVQPFTTHFAPATNFDLAQYGVDAAEWLALYGPHQPPANGRTGKARPSRDPGPQDPAAGGQPHTYRA